MPNLSPAQALVFGFAALIFAGGILLSLPISSATSKPVPFLDALFTATSAVCVTGLVVVDTATRYSIFGQVVILLLIQMGGLGIMTMTTLLALLLGKRINLRERLRIQEGLNQYSMAGVVALTKTVLIMSMLFEGTGALLLAFRFVPEFGWGRGLYFSLFHSVSAFNNAGFDLMGNFLSLTRYVADPLVSLTIAGLIIFGGLGFTVILGIYRKRRFSRLSFHAKLVLIITVVLLALGTIVILALEYGNNATIGRLSFGDKLLASFFQSVTPRTAGFNTVDIGKMRSASLFFLIMLMFIGASPASTGGGIKTTTAGVLLLAVWSMVRGNRDVEALHRRIPGEIVLRALTVAILAMLLLVGATMLLSITEPFEFLKILFEATSAFATVGLTTGITPSLSAAGKILIIILMYSGRVGPMTVAVAVANRQKVAPIRHPEEKVVVG
ncbi:MAG: TrkH family potassium uptake protein [Syntrophothermus sp.]